MSDLVLDLEIPPFTFPRVPYPKQWEIYSWLRDLPTRKIPDNLAATILTDLHEHIIPILFWNVFPSGVQNIAGFKAVIQRTWTGHWTGAIRFPEYHPDRTLSDEDLNKFYCAHGSVKRSGDWLCWRADHPGDCIKSDFTDPPGEVMFFTQDMAINQTEKLGHQLLSRLLFLHSQNSCKVSHHVMEWIKEYLPIFSGDSTPPRVPTPQRFLNPPEALSNILHTFHIKCW